MLILHTVQAEIDGNVSPIGYGLGALAILAVVAVVMLAVRLFRAPK